MNNENIGKGYSLDMTNNGVVMEQLWFVAPNGDTYASSIREWSTQFNNNDSWTKVDKVDPRAGFIGNYYTPSSIV